MRLLLKFNLIFVVIFSIGFWYAIARSGDLLQDNAQEEVLQQARLMMETAKSMRDYTTGQIRPLVESLQRKGTVFHPQTVPAYAATECFNNLRMKYPEYIYKEATLNPTNPRDRAVEWESDVINQFRNDPLREELHSIRSETPSGPSLYLAHPLRVKPDCLECHSTADKAPIAMIKLYGPSNGFNWRVNEVIGAQIVSVPISLPQRMAKTALSRLLYHLVGVALVGIVVLNIALYAAVVRPVTRFAEMADKISQGRMDVPELHVKGKDEIAMLAMAFNRMHRSLAKAMQMLEK